MYLTPSSVCWVVLSTTASCIPFFLLFHRGQTLLTFSLHCSVVLIWTLCQAFDSQSPCCVRELHLNLFTMLPCSPESWKLASDFLSLFTYLVTSPASNRAFSAKPFQTSYSSEDISLCQTSVTFHSMVSVQGMLPFSVLGFYRLLCETILHSSADLGLCVYFLRFCSKLKQTVAESGRWKSLLKFYLTISRPTGFKGYQRKVLGYQES